MSIARHSGARLVLATVATPLTEAFVEGIYFSTTELEREVQGRYEDYLSGIASKVKDHANIEVLTSVFHGDVATCLCDYLKRGEADLVVMATHGRGPMGRFWLGSVADEMVRHASAPVLLIRPGGGAPDLDREPEMGRIVLPLDGTPLAEQIIEPMVALAALVPGAECVLMRAIHALVPIEMFPEGGQAEKEGRSVLNQVQQVQQHLRKDAERYLEDVAARLRARGLRVRTEVVIEDKPALAILNEADREHATMIAMQTHGRRGLSRLVLGSVADKVVRGAHVPVLVQRPLKA
jgi:nucleotide-binding universal stress UspA family protein